MRIPLENVKKNYYYRRISTCFVHYKGFVFYILKVNSREAMKMQRIDKLITLIDMVDKLLENRVNHEEEMYNKTLERNMRYVANRLEIIEEQKEYLFALK